jgi:hypothetical protein
VIQACEFTFEAFWKAFKKIGDYSGPEIVAEQGPCRL